MPVTRRDLGSTHEAVGDWAQSVDADAFEAAVEDAARRRRAVQVEELEELGVALEELGRRQAEHEAELRRLIDRQQSTLEAADWCLAQNAQERRDRDEIDAATPVIEEHRRAAREANQRLERVLEQRAAAEAALEEARKELEDLGAVTFDETGVRRQLEEASRELTAAVDEHRRQLAELESCRSEVQRIEAEVDSDTEPADADTDQFRALHASIRARLRTESDPTVDDLDAARERLDRLEESVQELAGRMTVLRQRVQGLESELAARSRDGHSLGARQDAAEQLERQVTAVESRLGEAEKQARVDVEAATRVLSKTELGVERLHASAAERRRRLRSLADVLPPETKEAALADPLGAADRIGEALRAEAAEQQRSIERASADLEADRHELGRRRDDREERAAHLDDVLPEDRLAAIDHLLSGDDPVVIDLLVDDDRPILTLADLEAAPMRGPLVVLTDDPDVLAWAIGVPAERGAVVPAHALTDRIHLTDTTAPNHDMEQHTS